MLFRAERASFGLIPNPIVPLLNRRIRRKMATIALEISHCRISNYLPGSRRDSRPRLSRRAQLALGFVCRIYTFDAWRGFAPPESRGRAAPPPNPTILAPPPPPHRPPIQKPKAPPNPNSPQARH